MIRPAESSPNANTSSTKGTAEQSLRCPTPFMGYLVLVGMMGSGKTTIGRTAAEHEGVPFDDTDLILTRRLGRTIPQIFQLYGEEAFRSHETSVLASIEPETGVLATGGGIVLREENWVHLKRLGTTVFLDVPVEALIARLAMAKKRRPLLEVDGWDQKVRDLLDYRRPLYQKADVTLFIEEGDVEATANRLLEFAPWRQGAGGAS